MKLQNSTSILDLKEKPLNNLEIGFLLTYKKSI